jgi:hypothetical protein
MNLQQDLPIAEGPLSKSEVDTLVRAKEMGDEVCPFYVDILPRLPTLQVQAKGWFSLMYQKSEPCCLCNKTSSMLSSQGTTFLQTLMIATSLRLQAMVDKMKSLNDSLVFATCKVLYLSAQHEQPSSSTCYQIMSFDKLPACTLDPMMHAEW